jgi:hypothetical protein
LVWGDFNINRFRSSGASEKWAGFSVQCAGFQIREFLNPEELDL